MSYPLRAGLSDAQRSAFQPRRRMILPAAVGCKRLFGGYLLAAFISSS
jgi:hypothetical protein